MSGIAAIVRLDGGEVEPGSIETMTAAMAYRGPDGIAHWHGGAVALGQCLMVTDAASAGPASPLASEDGNFVLVFDGWLANAAELRAELTRRGARLRDDSDAELVLRAFELWGEDAPARLEGGFAFVVWDARRRAAFLARDHLGQCPLHFLHDGKRLIVASDLGAVAALPDVPRRPNRGFIAEVLANEWLSLDDTVWEGISRLRAAHWLRCDGTGLRRERYWTPPLEVTIRHASDADWFAHYRDVLEDAVRRTARTHLPLGCEVSGGLDSSALFCMADKLAREGRLPAPDLIGYSYLGEPGTLADEIAYARAVARHTGRTIREIDPFLPGADWFAERTRIDADMPLYPNGAMGVNIGKAAREDGCRVVLNGEGGDDWIAGKPFYFAEHLAERDLSGLLRSLAGDIADLGLRQTARNFVRHGLAPVMPRRVKDLLGQRGVPPGPHGAEGAYWLSPELSRLLDERRAAADYEFYRGIANPARRSLMMTMNDPFNDLMRSLASRQAARLGYDLRSPMHLRSYVDFAFAIPERVRCRGSHYKFLHAAALADLLPREVAERKSKAEFSFPFDRLLPGMADLLTREAPERCPDLLSREGTARLFGHYMTATDYVKPRWELWGVLDCLNLRRIEA